MKTFKSGMAAILLLMAISTAQTMLAQGPPPPPPNGGNPAGPDNELVGGGAPIGSGALILLTMLAGYGGFKLTQYHKKIKDETNQQERDSRASIRMPVFLLGLVLHVPLMAQVQIGEGTRNDKLPVSPNYNYSYTQTIYLQTEINEAFTIGSIQYYFAGSSLGNSNNWTIYLGHTPNTSFSSTNAWIPLANMTEVWSGTFDDPGGPGWISFDIADFDYNNIDNLVVAIDENAPGKDGSGDYFYTSFVNYANQRSIYYRDDDTNPDPSSPPGGNYQYYIANIRLMPNGEYAASTTGQIGYKVGRNITNQPVIRIEVDVDEPAEKQTPVLTEFIVNANGSSLPLESNIENAKIFYTGKSHIFSSANQFGSTVAVPSTSDFTISGTQDLYLGTNYFWLTYDIKASANLGDQVDAECVSLVVDGETKTPLVIAPTGARTISPPLGAGTYTIGSRSDYSSFAEVENDLNSLGIAGPVRFEVASETYNEQIAIGGVVGSSETNTIVFESATGNPDDVVLQFEPQSVAYNYVVNLDGTDYITFKAMTIQNTGSSDFGRVFYFTGISEHITIHGNKINGRDLSVSQPWNKQDNYVLLFGAQGNENRLSHAILRHNELNGGTTGIHLQGTDDASPGENNKMQNNRIDGFTTQGIRLEYQDAPLVNANYMEGKSVEENGLTGIHLESCFNDFEASQNEIQLEPCSENYGILVWYCETESANPGRIVNNFISIHDADLVEGIGIMNSWTIHVIHNTIEMQAVTGLKKGEKSGGQSCTQIDIWGTTGPADGLVYKNNLVANSTENKVYGVNQNATQNNYMQADYNCTYNPNTGSFSMWGHQTGETFTDWKDLSGQDANSSVVVDHPLLTPGSPGPGSSMVEVPWYSDVLYDIDGMPRTNPTNPGCTPVRCIWTNNGGDQDWNNPANWSCGKVPGPGDDVEFSMSYAGQMPFNTPENAECYNFIYTNPFDPPMDASGSQLDIYGSAAINDNAGFGTYNFTGAGDANLTSKSEVVDLHDSDVYVDASMKAHNDFCANYVKLYGSLTPMLGDFDISVVQGADFSEGTIDDPIGLQFVGTLNAEFKPGSNSFKSVVVDKDGNEVVDFMGHLQVELLKVLNGRAKTSADVQITGELQVGKSSGGSGVLEIEAGKSVVVEEDVVISETGEVVLKADEEESETGKLVPRKKIVKKPGGKFRAQRYYTGTEWHLISSPTNNAQASMFGGKVVQYHTEPDNLWHDVSDPEYLLEVMHGYSLWAFIEGLELAEFEGTPNSENQTFDFVSSGGEGQGWNLIGNPYPATLDWDEVTIPANLDATIYLWDPDINDYRYYLPGGPTNTTSQYVALAQGFFVHCNNAAGGTLTFTPDAITAEPATFYKNTENEQMNTLVYEVLGFPSTAGAVRFREDATAHFDPLLDAYRMTPGAGIPTVYTRVGNSQLAVNSLPDVMENQVVALEFNANTGDYVLNFTGQSTFAEAIPLYLKDKKMNTLTNLRLQDAYGFHVEEGDAASRFELLFMEAASTTENQAPEAQIQVQGHHVRIIEAEETYDKLQLFSLSGQLLTERDISTSNTSLYIAIKGCYIIRLLGRQATSSSKVIIR